MWLHNGTVRKFAKRYNEFGHAHELTFTCYSHLKMLNQGRSRQWFILALDQARQRWDLELWAYVIMPEHAHILFLPRRSDYDVSRILKTIKQSVARRAIRFLRANSPLWLEKLKVAWPSGRVEYRFWQQGGGYDRNINMEPIAWASVDYLHMNPVRRGLVNDPMQWRWSSARWYAGLDDVVLPMNAPPPDRPAT